MSTCYCGSDAAFSVCCEPVITNQSAETALQLMRSRYSAYCLGIVGYLRATCVAANRKQFTEKDIVQWLDQNRWTKLEIVSCDKGTALDSDGSVEFKAYFTDASGRTHLHHEKSRFGKEDGRWLYIDGQIQASAPAATAQKAQRNDPCPCGSGKKYKNCCA